MVRNVGLWETLVKQYASTRRHYSTAASPLAMNSPKSIPYIRSNISYCAKFEHSLKSLELLLSECAEEHMADKLHLDKCGWFQLYENPKLVWV